MKEIVLKLNKEFNEEDVSRNCEAIATCLRVSFENVSDENDYAGLRFITIKGDFALIEKNNALIITDVQNLNNVIIHKDVIWEIAVKF